MKLLISHNRLVHFICPFYLQTDDLQEYRHSLRMSPDLFQQLVNILCPRIQKCHTNFRLPIPPETRLAITLRYLALGDCFRTLHQSFRVGLSTARYIVIDTCLAIIDLMMQDYIQAPTTEAQWRQLAQEFEYRWNLPHCIGAVDGKHIRINQPPKSGSTFFNYKEYFSIVLMAVANPGYELRIYLRIFRKIGDNI